MKKITPYLLILFGIILQTKFAHAQTMSIKGTVVDTTEKTNLPYAISMAVRIKDSVLLGFARTDVNGNFLLTNLPIDTVQVTVSHPRFGDKLYFVFGSATNYTFDFGKIIMPPKTKMLDEVTIFAFKDPVYFVGDTLVYTADSFKVKPNATVEDLLKKLPGVKVDGNGKITVHGKQVDQLLVDGDEFFGTDPNTALKNLNANTINNVQVYETKNENNTDDGKETVQVMNLQLKDEAKKGYFGKINGASDFQNYHEGEVLFNKFSNTRKISVFGLVSNTPRNNFDFQDMWKYGMMGDEMQFFGDDDENNYFFFSEGRRGTSGIPKTLRTGIYYNEKIGKKTKLGFNYTLTGKTLRTKSDSRSQYFLPDTSYTTVDYSDKMDKSGQHKFNFTWEQKLDSLTDFELQSRLTLSNSNKSSFSSTQFLSQTDTLTRETDVTNSAKSSAYNAEITAKLIRKFKKPDRKFNISYTYKNSKYDALGFLKSANTFFNLPNANDTIDQQKTELVQSFSHDASLKWTEPITKKIKLVGQYNYSYNVSGQDKITRNFSNGEYLSVDSLFSNEMDNIKTSHSLESRFVYEVKKTKFSMGMRVRNIKMENDNMFTYQVTLQDVTNVLPFVKYNYNFSDTKRLEFSYNTSSSIPSPAQLQPVPDNTNPNKISIGNPNLIPTFRHGFSTSYNSYKPLSGNSIYVSANYSNTTNDFTRYTYIDSIGRMVSQTLNIDGNYYASANTYLSYSMLSRLLTLSPNFEYSVSGRHSYVNTQRNFTLEQNYSGGLNIAIATDTIEFMLFGSIDYSNPQSTLNLQSNKPYYTQNYGAEFDWILPKGFEIETDVNYQINSNRSDGFNNNIFLWNISLSRKFLKTENLILSIDAYDILNQNLQNSRNVYDNVITDSKTQVVSRYILFNLTYKFNSNKTKEEDEF